ncbi:hypothetical protein H6501_00090 [Candidatus Woesearchaeota archaeon]|nr:hypothetical protein [Nanoarchaeota archaeon]MCB9369981.1 hypothetical protein [Candidatus Woesearchaeota archaeon]USN44942.1 MAG: hypothetical protein H6500_01560 [Candidatus Woesearchaeota archaeon]
MGAHKRHLKRTGMPLAWPTKRKNITFTTRPKPGSHKREYVCPLGVVLRDLLSYATTTKEAKVILHNEEVLVNGKKCSDVKHPVGLFDIVEIKKTGDKFFLLFNEEGRFKSIPVEDSYLYLKVSKKLVLGKDKFQLAFMNGFTLSVDAKTFAETKVADTIIYDYTTKKISGTVSLKTGAFVYVFDGKYKGSFGVAKEFTSYHGLTKDVVLLVVGEHEHTTAKEYCFAIGNSEKDMKRFK